MKRLIYLLFALLLTVALVGCITEDVGDGDDGTERDTTAFAEETTESSRDTTDEPTDTTDEPTGTTDVPADTTDAPVDTTEAPTVTTEAPTEPEPVDTGFPNEAESEGTKRY